MITVALAKGRLANESAELFEKCGIDASVVFSDTRKLVLESADKKFSFFWSSRRTFPRMWNTG